MVDAAHDGVGPGGVTGWNGEQEHGKRQASDGHGTP